MFKHKPSKLKYRSDTITLDEIHRDLMVKLDSNYKKLEYLSKTRELIVDYYEKVSGHQYDINNIENNENEYENKNKKNVNDEYFDIDELNKEKNVEEESESEYYYESEKKCKSGDIYENKEKENKEKENKEKESKEIESKEKENNKNGSDDGEEEDVNVSIFSSDPSSKLKLLNLLSRKNRKAKKPVKKRKNETSDVGSKSIFQFFVQQDNIENREENKGENKEENKFQKKGQESFFEKLNRAELQEKFLFIVDKTYACSHVKVHKSNICDKCNIEKTLFLSEGCYICKKCGETENTVMENENNNYKETNYEKQKYPYKKINHLKEKLNQFQSKETADVPDKIYEIIMNDLRKKKMIAETITPMQIRTILKKHRQTNYYEHLQQIYCKVTNSPPITLSRDTEAQIVTMFQSIQEPFQRHRSDGRSNFLSYYYVLNKLFRIIGLEQHSLFFPLLKSKDKLREQDLIWAKICRDMNWRFHSSF